ncbi:MAG: RNase adapter RapZ [Burkholderiaceae bacterium]
MRVILVTGMSGSGKSIALHVLEDAGYAVVDNLPARFLVDVIGDLATRGVKRAAVSIDVRAGVEAVYELPSLLPALRERGHDVQLLFITADNATLVQRYSETRRRHPLSAHEWQGEPASGSRGLDESIDEERRLLQPLEGFGYLIDTSRLPAQALREWVRDFIGNERAALTLSFESFAFKQGVPADADLVFDVRCLPNPFYEPTLKHLTGLDQPVIDFLAAVPAVGRMIDDIEGFVTRWLPSYAADSRSYLTVAIGCTGGQHRSVYCVEQLTRRLRDVHPALVRHRALAWTAKHPSAAGSVAG